MAFGSIHDLSLTKRRAGWYVKRGPSDGRRAASEAAIIVCVVAIIRWGSSPDPAQQLGR